VVELLSTVEHKPTKSSLIFAKLCKRIAHHNILCTCGVVICTETGYEAWFMLAEQGGAILWWGSVAFGWVWYGSERQVAVYAGEPAALFGSQPSLSLPPQWEDAPTVESFECRQLSLSHNWRNKCMGYLPLKLGMKKRETGQW
jgi:hypothetical protein